MRDLSVSIYRAADENPGRQNDYQMVGGSANLDFVPSPNLLWRIEVWFPNWEDEVYAMSTRWAMSL